MQVRSKQATRGATCARPVGRSRGRLGALAITAMLSVVGCVPESAGPPSVTWTRPPCPFGSNIVAFGGDSLVTQWPRFVPLPSDVMPYNTAKGGSAYTGNLTTDPNYGTIGSRIIDDLNACGSGIGAVVLSGGHVDLSYGRTAEQVIASIDDLDQQLYDRGVHAVFLAITPVSADADWYVHFQSKRQAINAWMTTPGNMHGTVVDCAPQLESSPGSDALAQKYWNYIDAFGTIDLVHPNDAAYAVIGTCIQPAVLAALGR